MVFGINRASCLLLRVSTGSRSGYKNLKLSRICSVNFSVKTDIYEDKEESKLVPPVGEGKVFRNVEEVISDVPDGAKLLESKILD